jgi:hypothetical protein
VISTPAAPAVRIGRLHRVRAGRRLVIPDDLPATLGCDAVGLPGRYGGQIMDRLPRVGCVFATADHLWWIVPAGSGAGLNWPFPARYTLGAHIHGAARLVHRPEASWPYTPPIPLYVTVCHIAGVSPV